MISIFGIFFRGLLAGKPSLMVLKLELKSVVRCWDSCFVCDIMNAGFVCKFVVTIMFLKTFCNGMKNWMKNWIKNRSFKHNSGQFFSENRTGVNVNWVQNMFYSLHVITNTGTCGAPRILPRTLTEFYSGVTSWRIQTLPKSANYRKKMPG